jgi:hypothetical protein
VGGEGGGTFDKCVYLQLSDHGETCQTVARIAGDSIPRLKRFSRAFLAFRYKIILPHLMRGEVPPMHQAMPPPPPLMKIAG